MLATTGQALLDALANHRDIKDKLRAIERLPQLELKQLLQRYVADAPAFYLLPGSFRTVEDDLIVSFTLAGVVRNVGGSEKAFAGDGQDLGVDHLLQLAMRALHGHTIGECAWRVIGGELVDDPVFDETGVAAVEIRLESSPLPIEADWPIESLDSFKTFHADIDLQPHAGEIEYASWLQTPPNFNTSRPEATVDLSLQGA